VHAVLSTPRGLIPAPLKAMLLRGVLRRVLGQDRGILRVQRRNVERFAGPRYASSPLDVMRPYLVAALVPPGIERSNPADLTIEMLL
jgi:hypothetical protein